MWSIVHEDIPRYSSIRVAKVIGIISTYSHTINNGQYPHPRHHYNFCKGPRPQHNPSEQVRNRSSSPSGPLSHTSLISLRELSPSILTDDHMQQTCASFIQYSDKKLRSLRKIRRPPTSADDLPLLFVKSSLFVHQLSSRWRGQRM